MGVPTWEVGYTSAMPRREDHEVRQGHVGHWIKKKPPESVELHLNSPPQAFVGFAGQLFSSCRHCVKFLAYSVALLFSVHACWLDNVTQSYFWYVADDTFSPSLSSCVTHDHSHCGAVLIYWEGVANIVIITNSETSKSYCNFFLALRPHGGHSLLCLEFSRSHTTTHHIR